MMSFYQREPPVDPPEPKAVEPCEKCGQDVYLEEPMYLWDGLYICAECLEDMIRDMKHDVLAEVLGLTVKTVQVEEYI